MADFNRMAKNIYWACADMEYMNYAEYETKEIEILAKSLADLEQGKQHIELLERLKILFED